MNAKKVIFTLSAATLLTAAVPALAHDQDWRFHDRHAHERVFVPAPQPEVHYRRHGQPYVVYPSAPVYAPAPVYGAAPVYAPVYAERDNAFGTIGGAMVGAMIGSQIGYGDSRGAAIAAGAIIGGIIGSNF